MPSMQEALEVAFEKHENTEEQNLGKTTEDTAAGAGQEGTAESAPPAEPTAGERARDTKTGKFASKQPDEESLLKDGKPAEEKPVGEPPKPLAAPAASPAPATQAVKAPVSWRPEVREKFGALPPEVQAEVNRREREVEQGLRSSADARRFVDEFSTTLRPYEAMLRSENATPVQAVSSLMNTAYQLRYAAPQPKAQLVAQIIQQFGVDISLLDDILSSGLQGQTAQPKNDPTLAYIERELAPIKQFVSQIGGLQSQAQQRSAEAVQAEIDAFVSDPANEFFTDVREDIADLLELAAKRGTKLTLQDAYKRATMAHPTISEVLANRAVTGRAQQQSAAARRSKNAAASIPSGGAPEQQGETKPKNLRSAIEAAWDDAENRSGS